MPGSLINYEELNSKELKDLSNQEKYHLLKKLRDDIEDIMIKKSEKRINQENSIVCSIQ